MCRQRRSSIACGVVLLLLPLHVHSMPYQFIEEARTVDDPLSYFGGWMKDPRAVTSLDEDVRRIRDTAGQWGAQKSHWANKQSMALIWEASDNKFLVDKPDAPLPLLSGMIPIPAEDQDDYIMTPPYHGTVCIALRVGTAGQVF